MNVFMLSYHCPIICNYRGALNRSRTVNDLVFTLKTLAKNVEGNNKL